MEKRELVSALKNIFFTCPGNILTEETAMMPELVGLTIFEEPLIGFANAKDPLFAALQSPEAIGHWHKLPDQWQPRAKTVISLFLPFTEEIRSSNRKDHVSLQWLQGRIEGQAFINEFTCRMQDWLIGQGIETCAPSVNSQFFSYTGKGEVSGHPDIPGDAFGSNWSERHAAYICGLGTFGLSKGLITQKGIAGRFTSLITTLPLEADPRPYTGLYDYCIMCGACVNRCPVQAISLESGKNHPICSRYLDESKARFAPRYGCGLCQTSVPCEDRIPALRNK